MSDSNALALEALFSHKGDIVVQTEKIIRFECIIDHSEVKLDQFSEMQVEADCVFLKRKAINIPQSMRISLQGNYQIKSIDAGGWLLKPMDASKPYYWIPSLPLIVNFNSNQQITSEFNATITNLNISNKLWEIDVYIPANSNLCVTCWQFFSSELYSELVHLVPIETNGYFLWGSHTQYQKPSDLYKHLLHGYIYENRFGWPHYWKTFSENDAHALYVVLNGLKKSTGKILYSILKQQILLSAIARQNTEGAWLHGMWTHHMECHYRLHCSGMHLLMDALSERKDPAFETALRKAAAFIASKVTVINAGNWFLHDSLETNDETIKEHPGGRYNSHVLGKNNCNLLVLNTHLDTTIALARYVAITDDQSYIDIVNSARNATRSLLTLHPAEFIYRIAFKIIYWTWLPQNKAINLPLPKRILKRIGWKYLTPKIHWLKNIFPRIVMPGGYIDRTIGAKGLADQYHVINLMDLLRHKHRFPDDDYDTLIHDALEFTYQSGIIDFWCEQNSKRYALGFWAECLYLANKIYHLPQYKIWLTEALLKLKQNNIGTPPSFLKGNNEAELHL